MVSRASILVATVTLWSWSTPAVANVRTIVLRGDSAETGEDATFSSFNTPSLNNRGQVAFGAELVGGDVATGNSAGIWVASSGSLHTVIREGDPAPGMPAGTSFHNMTIKSAWDGVPLNDSGEIAVGLPVILADSSTSSGLWAGSQHSLSLLAAQGSPAPGAQNDAPFGGLASLRTALNGRGDVAFIASLTAAPYTTINSNNYHDGLWVLNREGTVATVLAGDSAEPLGEIAQIVGFATFTRPSLNGNGQAAFQALHRLSGVNYQPSIWVTIANGIELRGAVGQPLPEIGDNAVVSHAAQPGFNSARTTAFNGSFQNSGGTPPSGNLIMVSETEGYSLQAYGGAPAAGLPGYSFQSTSYEPSIGSSGHIAFYGTVTNGTISRSGVWTGQPGELEPIALSGDVAPNSNATFGSFIRNTPAVNRFGQVAFPSGLTDLQSSATSSSLWATDLDGNLVMIARTGTAMEVAEGDVRTVSALSMRTNHGDDDGRPRGMNDLGQIAFHANFTDGSSGILLSNAVAHLPGDYNGDLTVDGADYIVWRKSLGTPSLIGDGDRNGVVDEADYRLMSEFFGMSLVEELGGGSVAAVPEPQVAVIGVILALLILRRGRESALIF